jgi:hypothetical protein
MVESSFLLRGRDTEGDTQAATSKPGLCCAYRVAGDREAGGFREDVEEADPLRGLIALSTTALAPGVGL